MTKEEIIQDLQPMFKEAREKNLWFVSTYQDIAFTPDELESQQKLGKFILGKVNWKLTDPMHLLKAKQMIIQSLQYEVDELYLKIYHKQKP